MTVGSFNDGAVASNNATACKAGRRMLRQLLIRNAAIPADLMIDTSWQQPGYIPDGGQLYKHGGWLAYLMHVNEHINF
ncbi:hypothetical protein SB6419_01681 [Klebsiella spallanzanii]|nr:hypothetical protein SB6419_01681 [Klebsiella spallanzanii]